MGIDATMFFTTTQKLTTKELRTLCYEVGTAFGADRFWRDFKGWKYPAEVMLWAPHHNISYKGARAEQDGPDLVVHGRELYEVHVSTRYYGKGYERGDFAFLYTLAGWLEQKIPQITGAPTTIYYGGDSSGVCAKPFGAKARADLMAYFASAQGRAYYDAVSFAPKCETPVCKHCEVPMNQSMTSNYNQTRVCYCSGCGEQIKTEDGGKTWVEWKEDR